MANASVSPVRPKDKAARVLFVRVGSMKFYAGPQEGDEKPRGGGRYTKEGIGHELFNFFKFGDRLYGFVRAVGEKIDLDKIDPAARGKLASELKRAGIAPGPRRHQLSGSRHADH